jgi:hypothetical protein
MGCGRGDLARALAASGCKVVAIDPCAPAGGLFQAVSLDEFTAAGAFDGVVATRAAVERSALAS